MQQAQKILIIGGGIGGIAVAQELARLGLQDMSICLVDPKSHLEYHGAMYRMVTGRSPMEVCIPYSSVRGLRRVRIERDSIQRVDVASKLAWGSAGGQYAFDTLVLALGSSPAFYGVPGAAEHCSTFQDASSAAKLRTHLEAIKENPASRQSVVVVGGGATGVELAAELAAFVPRSCTVTLIEAGPRILSGLPEHISLSATSRLRSLGVDVQTNQSVLRVDARAISLANATIPAETIIWTAGMKATRLPSPIDGLEIDSRGRFVVDDFLRARGFPMVYAIGDCASTPESGNAVSALGHAHVVAQNILRAATSRSLLTRSAQKVSVSIPIGPHYALSSLGRCWLRGRLGWLLRRVFDLRLFLRFLPIADALSAFCLCRSLPPASPPATVLSQHQKI